MEDSSSGNKYFLFKFTNSGVTKLMMFDKHNLENKINISPVNFFFDLAYLTNSTSFVLIC